MKTLMTACLMAGTALSLTTTTAAAQEHNHHNHHEASVSNHSTHHAGHNHDDTVPAPLGVMGDHTHDKGEWMVSYRYMRMEMDGNLRGNNSISPTEIVSTLANPHAGPANVRVVPTEMTMQMHMLGAMYGVSDELTIMAMAMYHKKDMEHITFAGMSGTTELGRFTTRTSGWGDTSLSGIYKLYEDENHTVNISLGISAPTGSIKEEDTVLTPMGTTPTLRLPYAMQLGSGTWDALPSLTYSGHSENMGWGLQYKGTIRLEDENSQGYRWGNQHIVTGWAGYKFTNEFSATANIRGETMGKIKGSDTRITAPVQTANPDNYGGDIVSAGLDLSYRPQAHALKGIEFGIGISAPVYQDVNGVQMERDWNLSAGISYRF